MNDCFKNFNNLLTKKTGNFQKIFYHINKKKYLKIDTNLIFNFLLKNTNSIEIFGCLNLNENQQKKLKKEYSYNLIYTTFRKILRNNDKFFVKKLIFICYLLDNSNLIYKNLYPEIKIIKKNNLNIINSLKIFYSVLKVDSNVINDKKYLLSVFVLVCEILIEKEKYGFYERNQIFWLLKFVKVVLTEISNFDVLKGILKGAFDNLSVHLNGDVLFLYGNLKLLFLIYRRIQNNNLKINQKDVFRKDILKIVMKIGPVRPLIDELEFLKTCSALYRTKYEIFEFLEYDDDLSENLANDLKNCYDFRNVLTRIKKLSKNIKIDILLEVILRNKESGSGPIINNEKSKIPLVNEVSIKKISLDESIYPSSDQQIELIQENIMDTGREQKNEIQSIDKKKNYELDEENSIAIFEFILKNKFFEKIENLNLIEKLLQKKSEQFVLLGTFKLIKNLKRAYSDKKIKILSFLFVCNLEKRSKIIKQKEKLIFKYLNKKPEKIINIFIEYLFLNLQKNNFYKFSSILLALLMEFGEKINFNQSILNYFLKFLKYNRDTVYEKLYFSIFCLFNIKKFFVTESKTFHKSLINLICNSSDFELRNDISKELENEKESNLLLHKEKICDDLLFTVFDSSEKDRNILKQHYFYFMDPRNPIESEYLNFFKDFNESYNQKLNKEAKKSKF